MKKFAVVLSGCGVFDGAEIHEATLSLYAIAKNGCAYEIFAPDIDQHHVVNHLNGKEMPEKRNVLVEAARIARGKISPLSGFSASSFDALLFPGGFGAAKNLSDWAFKGSEAKVLPEVEKAIKAMIEQKKPIGALCISPVLLALILGKVRITIGNDPDTAAGLKALGAEHIVTTHGDVIIDHRYKLATTPCYMLDAGIVQIATGAMNIVEAMMEMMN
ncbi:MAG: isoprenoid biosynthesis glyoxalase ElbB [Bacteroidota bacterium]